MNNLLHDLPIDDIEDFRDVALFDPETRYFVGVGCAYPDPLTPGEFYAPPNSVEHFPENMEMTGHGIGYWLSEDLKTWNEGRDYSQCILYHVDTLEVFQGQLPPGETLPGFLTPVPPPSFTLGQWPRWDDDAKLWGIGRNMAGVDWYKGDETGVLECPWDELPEGATEGLHPEIVRNANYCAKINQIEECKKAMDSILLMLQIDPDGSQSNVNKNMLKLYESCLRNTVSADIDSADFELPKLPLLEKLN